MTFLEKSLFNFTTFETNRNETNTQCQKINRNEIFRDNRNGFGQISVWNTSTRLQLSAVSRPPELASHCAN